MAIDSTQAGPAYSELSQKLLARMAAGETLRPIFRWRWFRHRAGEERPWQYVAPESEADVIRLWNAQGPVEVEPLSVEMLNNALSDAYEAGVAFEKFGRPADQLYARLGYRRCSRRRSDTVVNTRSRAMNAAETGAERA